MNDHPSYVKWGRISTITTAWLFAACVALQVFLAGLATFDAPDGPAHWAEHVSFGQWIGVLTILLLVFAIAGRLPRMLVALSALVLVLYGMQYPFANTDASSMAALHAVNALALFSLSIHIGARARTLPSSP
ncbi:MAG TPA: DUF6220 domain-containing protein [Thermomicrobiales bacterium]|nr:DUF6220 domain-containing protein [Thermomicrobiales bacterium]